MHTLKLRLDLRSVLQRASAIFRRKEFGEVMHQLALCHAQPSIMKLSMHTSVLHSEMHSALQRAGCWNLFTWELSVGPAPTKLS